ncbi:3-hydroxyacyl-ACP dehydratase FabZ family protein [Cochleicola gelatinilyticus]|uniref:Hydroxymyristoyl-ACP dehydratase n=1 Tax=Cochleicola gelatinilyticus TaxID=1763537 RepID=A0A167GWE9_9FLAO|nr:hotdog domain-containing protein [Cochleicola gelatinilyticus]OAB77973.1 hydroxymyristoyl-ACP dehydratase [Cochleicola gelatinilyticus]
MKPEQIQNELPYAKPFLFVDKLEHVDENGARGHYTFPESSFFYEGHFPEYKITPGVILTECMAQIGVVALGIYIYNLEFPGARIRMVDAADIDVSIALAETHIDFKKPVFPNEKVTVISTKEYYRFNKLKCKVEMRKENGDLACRGFISGVIIPQSRRG